MRADSHKRSFAHFAANGNSEPIVTNPSLSMNGGNAPKPVIKADLAVPRKRTIKLPSSMPQSGQEHTRSAPRREHRLPRVLKYSARICERAIAMTVLFVVTTQTA